jgi:DnaJ-class molecular chaperone
MSKNTKTNVDLITHYCNKCLYQNGWICRICKIKPSQFKQRVSDVPDEHWCKKCNGIGVLYPNFNTKCPRCEGTGCEPKEGEER